MDIVGVHAYERQTSTNTHTQTPLQIDEHIDVHTVYVYIYMVTPPRAHILYENYVHLHLPLTKHSCTSLWNLYTFLNYKWHIFQCWLA